MPSVFSEEWRDCLRSHYTYVVRTDDRGTERTLRGVMIEAGFNEDEIRQLYVMATAHVDAVSADFVPDMAIFEAEAAPVMVAVAVPQEAIEVQLIEESLQRDEIPDAEDEAGEPEEPPPQDDPDVTQLSLF